jgi:hypothetical protein
MQKNILLNLTGIAALSMLCACGSLSEKSVKEEPKQEQPAFPTEEHKEAAAELPAGVQQAADVTAQAETQAQDVAAQAQTPVDASVQAQNESATAEQKA